jgi:hypothetical protein
MNLDEINNFKKISDILINKLVKDERFDYIIGILENLLNNIDHENSFSVFSLLVHVNFVLDYPYLRTNNKLLETLIQIDNKIKSIYNNITKDEILKEVEIFKNKL